MKKRIFHGRYGILTLVFCCFVSCSRCSLPGQSPADGGLTVLSYNCENIFDDVSDGTEYPEFDPSGGSWNTRLFHTRLMNLAEVIRASCEGGPDIVALQEIENEKVIDTLAGEYLKGMGYRWRLCIPGSGSAVNTGVLSRFPFETFRAHRLETGEKDVLRNILEVWIETGSGSLVLFNNHWKSKLGGEEETEILRRHAASLLCRRIREISDREADDGNILIVGDLNENPDEYIRTGEAYQTALMPMAVDIFSVEPGSESMYLTGDRSAASVTGDRVIFYCPWEEGEEGSYLYGSQWERIDHILLGAGFFDTLGLEYASFEVVDEPFLFTEDGRPFAWNGRIGRGYSDHLPLLLRLEIRPDGGGGGPQ